MIQFKGFKPEAEERIARTMGYSGDMNGFATHLAQNPEKQDTMNFYRNQAIGMLKGGVVTEQELDMAKGGSISAKMSEMAFNPTLPTAGTVKAQKINVQPNQIQSYDGAFVKGDVAADTEQATTYQAETPTVKDAPTIDTSTVTPAVKSFTEGVETLKSEVPTQAIADAAQMEESSVGTLDAAQGQAILMDNPVQREIQQGELVSGAADAVKAAKFTEQVQEATAQPSEKTTVKGQMDTLMADFEGGNTPAWAAGAMRAATSAMAARGLGASSMAGQAIVQAAMESAIPIASQDAKTQASFEAQNLSNRQQRAMLAAQQRANFMGMEFTQDFQARVSNAAKVSDVANMNFNAEQQIALENSRAANTMNMANLNNEQSLVMAQAAALSQMDMSNLSNSQQAAVMNAQSFLAMDMKNLDIAQQTSMFKNQSIQQGLFTDAAQQNAAKQFNAKSKMQTDQFFSSLISQTSQFNASQANAISQFNSGEKNVINRFNAELVNQRDQFNAKNKMIIDQHNTQWRREVATRDTAAINRANELNATAVLDMQKTAYNNLWNTYNDNLEYAWQSGENEKDRQNKLAQIKLEYNEVKGRDKQTSKTSAIKSIGKAVGKYYSSKSYREPRTGGDR